MLHIETTIDIDAPVDEVWRRLAKLDDVQNWVRSVKKSYYSSDQTEGIGAERTCEVQGFGTLREKIVEWRDGESLAYTAEGMPSVVKRAQNTWRLEPIDARRTRVRSRIDLETRYGVFGTLMGRLMMRPQMTRLMKEATASFKDFVEQSTPATEVAPSPARVHLA